MRTYQTKIKTAGFDGVFWIKCSDGAEDKLRLIRLGKSGEVGEEETNNGKQSV